MGITACWEGPGSVLWWSHRYSGTSINGPSQKRTTSQKRTVTKAPIETAIELMY